MKLEFVPTGETCIGYFWKGFDAKQIGTTDIAPYPHQHYGDGFGLCDHCQKFKQNHGLMNLGKDHLTLVCPESYVLTSPNGQRMLIYSGDQFFIDNFKVLSTEFTERSLKLVDNEVHFVS